MMEELLIDEEQQYVKVSFNGYIPEDDYALVTIEYDDLIAIVAFTHDEREAIVCLNEKG